MNQLIKIFAEQIAELIKWAGAVATLGFLAVTLSGCEIAKGVM